ncbi:hypothetical protein SH2C18_26270 [Clostridium sediminicola]|uniref:type II secretion system protein n=1 Tax=Clostridium sediminicola TaxID=3114879 RepID=UPI0031F22C34
MYNKTKKGFTLIELIIVIAILSILALITIPKFINYSQNTKLAADRYNAKIIGDAINFAYQNGDISLSNNNSFKGVDSSGKKVSFTGSGRSFEKIFVPNYIDKKILDNIIDKRQYVFNLNVTASNIKVDVKFNPASKRHNKYPDEVLYTINISK